MQVVSEKWQFWIDRGGTFTDIIARTPQGEIRTKKLLSENPGQYEDAALEGILNLLRTAADGSADFGSIGSIKMGTTVATNALLERRGETTAFLTTRGFADTLRIAYQNRPDLFARHIVLPDMLYDRVIEINERIDADGNVLIPADKEEIAEALRNIYTAGITSLAVAFMHAYRYSAHELLVKEIALEIGFKQISLSHQVSPLIKLVSRGDTTVADAYLSPVLHRYIHRLESALSQNGTGTEKPSLLFMQSNGGLTHASTFHGKDALLSGPAGGVVGMTQTGLSAGFEKIIGFDMGGTSTDVTHYCGNYERSMETLIAGVRIRAPMMHIHTIAAGGGSILNFDGTRFRVGPDSAGADPGPAAYRRGGPLTITDCNILLGKIQTDHFPSVFGPDFDAPPDRECVAEAFTAFASEIQIKTGKVLSREQVASGYLRIAVENMANAIKKISVQRGYDVTDYTLNCFGGAGAQHACMVADSLGIESIFIHPLAGVLSAYGMGLADIHVIREKQINELFTGNTDNLLTQACEELCQIVTDEVLTQGIAEKDITVIKTVYLRYTGSDTCIAVNVDSYEKMYEEFIRQHTLQFGFTNTGSAIIMDSVALEAVGKTSVYKETESFAHSEERSARVVEMYSEDSWQHVPLFKRSELSPGEDLKGPAIISEEISTVVVESGWRARSNEFGHLTLQRISPRQTRRGISAEVDPVMLEVFNNLFMSIAEQMGLTLAKTAYSINIKERLDFSCALFDANGALVANAPHVPVHLGSMGESVKAIMEKNRDSMKPGDAYMLNDPYHGGTHLPDVTVITPVFDKAGASLLFFVGSRGHHADIGGRTPGSNPPDSTTIHEEGVVVDNFLLLRDGKLREENTRELLLSGDYPCRNPDQNIADLKAQIAANRKGEQELLIMVEHYGLAVVQSYMQHVQDNAEECVRRAITELDDGEFIYPMDNGAEIHIGIRINKEERSALIDFSGTSKQDDGNYNAPLAVSKAAVLYVFRTLVNADIPLNEGCMRPLTLRIPEDSMLNPRFPAAIIAGNTEISQCVCDALFAALGVLASSQGTMNNFVYGNNDFQNYETICGGSGAGYDHHGTDAVHTHMTNTRMTDPEVLESRFPVHVEAFAIRPGSGGDGLYRGGCGVIRKMRFLNSATVTLLSSHRKSEPYGLAGGKAGTRGMNYLLRSTGEKESLQGNDEAKVNRDDIVVIETPGGGGFGIAKK